ncbi:MAG: segregation/condensation protein A [Clostridia bacterium]|nr:segregation/condensation protein A [Clostridia bacterium]
METLTYRIEQFEGPLDLLLTLIQKNKMNIEDIPIAEICDQYLEYIAAAQSMDMELAGEFIVMASELIRIKSSMLLPRLQPDEKDPRAELADALLRYQQAKQAAQKMAALYALYSGRFVKDTDEITVDTTYVSDQQVTSLCAAVRRIIAANESRPKAEKQVFAPMIAKPIVPVEVKIVGILHHINKRKNPSMQDLLSDATSLPDMIAIFLGILELIKVRKIRIEEDPDHYTVIHGTNTKFVVNEDPSPEDGEKKPRVYDDSAPIPLSSKAEMHREQRRIIREQKLAEKKRLRAEERARRAEERRLAKEAQNLSIFAEELPADDSDLEEEARVAELLDNQLSESDEDLLDDIGMDMNEIVRTMTEKAKELSPTTADTADGKES